MSSHLSLGNYFRDENNADRNIAVSHWNITDGIRVSRADLRMDYAKQAYIPVSPSGTTSDFFVQKQDLDINMFGIMNEGSG